jgi:signal transduction histidine kinase
MAAPHGTKKVTAIVLRGSVIVAIALTFLIFVHGSFSGNILGNRILFGIFIIFYLFVAEYCARRQHYTLAGWMVMALYSLLATVTLLMWGLNAPVGILAVGFVVFLSGLILGPKHIPLVVLLIAILLSVIQYIHSAGYIKPDLEALAKPSHYFDIIAYTTIFAVFALIAWLSGKQTEHSLERAKVAEGKLRAEKESLADKLEEQSVRLRETQLQEMISLYKFAAIGQTTTATLHELSNLLSILTLDIDDIGQQHQRSKAIINTKDGIDTINSLVRQARRQLHNNRNVEVFNAIPVIEQIIKDLQPKFRQRSVEIHKQIPMRNSFRIIGDTLNLSHVLTILINNALDACTSIPNAKVTIRLQQDDKTLKIDVIDNGVGISKTQSTSLFSPHQSSKPSGLGIGLYITRHIVENQLHGKISFKSPTVGAHFSIELPRYLKDQTNDISI